MELLAKDKIMEKLAPLLRKAAETLMHAEQEKRSVVIRYHNDADGITGALALFSSFSLSCKARQQNSAIYSERDADYDLIEFSGENKPLLIFVDFGASEESMRGLQIVKGGGVEIIVIDHHPPAKGAKDEISLFVSPWAVTEDEKASRYPAGYLCAEIARLAGAKNSGSALADSGKKENTEELARVSCAGDKSDVLETAQRHRDIATALDYLALFHKRGNLPLYGKLLEGQDFLRSTLAEARHKMDEICTSLLKGVARRKIREIEVYVINMERMFEDFDFPSRGKIISEISEILEKKEAGKAIVVLGYGKRAVMLRLNDKALGEGVDARIIMEKLRLALKDFIENAGGHAKAAAARVFPGYAKSAAEEILRIMESNGGGSKN